MAAGTETEHARSVLHCVLHLFLNSKQRTKLETVNSDGIYFRSLDLHGLEASASQKLKINKRSGILGYVEPCNIQFVQFLYVADK